MRSIHDSRLRGPLTEKFLDPDPINASREPDVILTDMHTRYLAAIASKTILLGKKNTLLSRECLEEARGNQGVPEYKAIPYIARGTEAYTRRSQARVYRLQDRWRSLRLPKGMIITISPRAVGPMYPLFTRMKELWPKFTNWLRMRYGGLYVWAIEPTQRSYPHYHMILARRARKGEMAQSILGWWQSKGVDIADPGVDVQHVRGDGASYALKYVTKGCNDGLWSAMLWLTGKRLWGASRGLGNQPINSQPENPPERDWTLIGIVPTVMIEWIMQDRPPPEDIAELAGAYIRREIL